MVGSWEFLESAGTGTYADPADRGLSATPPPSRGRLGSGLRLP
jgi:hypothetical protein